MTASGLWARWWQDLASAGLRHTFQGLLDTIWLNPMREGSRFVSWRGEHFRFDRLEDRQGLACMSPVWAVSRHREFIGTMSGVDRETTKEFEVRCVSWLAALLE